MLVIILDETKKKTKKINDLCVPDAPSQFVYNNILFTAYNLLFVTLQYIIIFIMYIIISDYYYVSFVCFFFTKFPLSRNRIFFVGLMFFSSFRGNATARPYLWKIMVSAIAIPSNLRCRRRPLCIVHARYRPSCSRTSGENYQAQSIRIQVQKVYECCKSVLTGRAPATRR